MSDNELKTGHRSVVANVEHICGLGCTRVYEIIETLERGEDSKELKGMSTEHRAALLEELKAIMAVYEERDEG